MSYRYAESNDTIAFLCITKIFNLNNITNILC